MKQKMILSWLLLLATLLLCACNGSGAGKKETENTDEIGEAPIQSITLALNGKATYKIVIPEMCDEKIIKAADALKERLNSVTSVFFSVTDDYIRNGEVAESNGEIIIGNCRRTEMQAALSTLTYRDYSISATENNVLIAGYDPSKVSDAVYEFIKLLENGNVQKENKQVTLSWSGTVKKEYTSYKMSGMTLAGVPLDRYSIVYPSNVKSKDETSFYVQYANEVLDIIGRRSGSVLKIVSDASEPSEYEILLGKTNRPESLAFYASQETPGALEYGIARKDKKLLLYAGGLFSLDYAVQMLNGQISALETANMDTMSDARATRANKEIPTNTAEYRFMTYNILHEGYAYGGVVTPYVEIRKEPISYLILEYAADVVALEECFYDWHYQLPELLGDQYAFVCANRKDGEVNRTPLVYRTDRLILVDSGYVDLEKTVTNNRRVITWAVFENKTNGERFAVIATHWDPFSEDAKLDSSKVMAELAMKFQTEQNLPVIAMGDFNSVPSNAAYLNFYATSGLTGVTQTTGVDHIFYASDFNLVAQGVERENCAGMTSDHFPVWIDVNLG